MDIFSTSYASALHSQQIPDASKPQRRHYDAVKRAATPLPSPQGPSRPISHTRDGDGSPQRHDVGSLKGFSPPVRGPMTTPCKIRDGAKIPSKHDSQIPQLVPPPSQCEPASPLAVDGPINSPSENNYGPVPTSPQQEPEFPHINSGTMTFQYQDEFQHHLNRSPQFLLSRSLHHHPHRP